MRRQPPCLGGLGGVFGDFGHVDVGEQEIRVGTVEDDDPDRGRPADLLKLVTESYRILAPKSSPHCSTSCGWAPVRYTDITDAVAGLSLGRPATARREEELRPCLLATAGPRTNGENESAS